MKRAWIVILAVLGGLVVLGGAAALLVALIVGLGRGRVPANTVLELDLTVSYPESVMNDPVEQLLYPEALTVWDVVAALERASEDDRVAGLVAHVGAVPMGMARIQEIRDAILDFRESGKFAIAWSDTFGEVGPGNGAYYLATAFDEIRMQSSGDLGLTGLLYESPFLRGTLDKLGVEPRLDHRHEYKNAMNLYTETAYDDAHREAMQALVDGQFAELVEGIASGRNLGTEEVRRTIDRGPFLGREAVDAGLVDSLAYRDEVWSEAKARAGDGARLLYLSRYLERAGTPYGRGRRIALVYGVGPVVRGESGYDPIFDGASMGSETVSAAIRDATEDDDVAAIVFRVDSPGGSYVASDTIWRETERARQAGKPIVVSMGDVAASGGYFVSMSADAIVAQPGTITGSIGVLGGKLLTSGFWEKLGLSWDDVHRGRNATMWTGTHDYSESEWERFQAWLDRVYDDFTTKVAAGREIDIDRVREIARGRVWTGVDAKERGLVDELGGLTAAVRIAKERAGIAPEESVRVEVFPRPRSLFQQLLDRGSDSSEGPVGAVVLRRVVETIRPLARTLRAAGFGPERGVLWSPTAEALR